jgi:hypothetical protein
MRRQLFLWAGVCVYCSGLLALPGIRAEDKKTPPETSVSDLSLEVQALRTLRALKITPEQRKLLGKLSKQTAQPERERTSKASKEYRQTLRELREALAGEDDDQIEALDEKLGQLTESEKPDLDDQVDITDAARKHAAELAHQLRTQQVASYIASVAEQTVDPRDHLVDLLDEVRKLDLAEWKEQKRELSEEIAKLVAGTDAKKNEAVQEKVLDLLSRARSMKAEDYKTQRADLEKTAQEIVGDIGPTDVLRNVLEWGLAELLSNPRLEAALNARLP